MLSLCQNGSIIYISLLGVEALCSKSQKALSLFEEIEIGDVIQRHQFNEYVEIYNKSLEILERFFKAEEVVGSERLEMQLDAEKKRDFKV